MFSQAQKPTVINAQDPQLVKLKWDALSPNSIASAFKLVADLSMMLISIIDHSRSPRPSVLLNSYLSLTLLLDAAQTRTLFLSSDNKSALIYSSIFIAALAVKFAILLLESRQMSRLISWNEKEHSLEETNDMFSFGVLFWLNKMFLKGYSKVLVIGDLYSLDSSFNAEFLHDEFSKNRDYFIFRGDKFGLLKVCDDSSEKITTNSVQGSEMRPLEATTTNTLSLAQDVDESRPFGDRTVYKHYFKSMGWYSAACKPNDWTDDTFSKPQVYYAGIYALLQISSLISLRFLGIALFIVFVKKAGAKLHPDALRTTSLCTMAFLHQDGSWRWHRLVFTGSESYRYRIAECNVEYILCVLSNRQRAVMLTSSLYLTISYPLPGALLTLRCAAALRLVF
ncbi:hypothetical protein EAF04_005497 [Stromatinia cepivora]|nr:hypothetical protein EAF04_005497 [Stromatinia cepivora]